MPNNFEIVTPQYKNTFIGQQLNVWCVEAIGSLLSNILNPSFAQVLSSLLNDNISNAIISFKNYPFNLANKLGDSNIETQDLTLGGNNTVLLEDVKKVKSSVTMDNFIFDMGKTEITRYFNNYLDFKKTSLQIWLPYIGFRTLPNEIIMGKWLHIEYLVDILTGNLTAYLSYSLTQNGTYYLFQTETGVIGLDIPLTTNNVYENRRNLISSIINFGANSLQNKISSTSSLVSGAVQIATGGDDGGKSIASGIKEAWSGKVSNTTSLVNNVLNSQVDHCQTSNMPCDISMWYAPQKCFVVITRPKPISNSNYIDIIGLPCGRKYQLSVLATGSYVKVEQVHMSGFDYAMQNEIDEIERLLKDGIII